MRFLEPLLDHNAVDVLALAALVAHLHDGRTMLPQNPTRSLALGRLALAAGSHEVAGAHLRLAINGMSPCLAREDAMRDLAIVCRSLGGREGALPELEWLAERSFDHGLWARQQLAIHCEHHVRDFNRALELLTVGRQPPVVRVSNGSSPEDRPRAAISVRSCHHPPRPLDGDLAITLCYRRSSQV